MRGHLTKSYTQSPASSGSTRDGVLEDGTKNAMVGYRLS